MNGPDSPLNKNPNASTRWWTGVAVGAAILVLLNRFAPEAPAGTGDIAFALLFLAGYFFLRPIWWIAVTFTSAVVFVISIGMAIFDHKTGVGDLYCLVSWGLFALVMISPLLIKRVTVNKYVAALGVLALVAFDVNGIVRYGQDTEHFVGQYTGQAISLVMSFPMYLFAWSVFVDRQVGYPALGLDDGFGFNPGNDKNDRNDQN